MDNILIKSMINLQNNDKIEKNNILPMQIAHELNNLMGPLLIVPEFLADKLSDNNPAQVELHHLNKFLKKLHEFIQNYTFLTYPTPESMGQVILNQEIDQLLESPSPFLNMREKIRWDKIEDSPIHVYGRSEPVRIILTQMLNIAAEGASSDSVVHISIGHSPDPKYILVEIKDNSYIPPEHCDKFFDPFYAKQTLQRYSGSGLGPTVARHLLEQMKGHLEISSQMHEGSITKLYFRRIEEKSDFSDMDVKIDIEDNQ